VLLIALGIGAAGAGVWYLMYRHKTSKVRVVRLRKNPINRKVSPGYDYKTGERLTTRSDYSTLYRNYYAAMDAGNEKKAIVIARIVDAKSKGQTARKR
jgi:hypothetical protein